MSVDSASPLTIFIIRHAEKPGEIWPGPGLTREGKEDDKSLVIRGWERAGAWTALFGTLLDAEVFPRPSVIYAANPEAKPPPAMAQFVSLRIFCRTSVKVSEIRPSRFKALAMWVCSPPFLPTKVGRKWLRSAMCPGEF